MLSPRAGARSPYATLNAEDLSRILNEEGLNENEGLVGTKGRQYKDPQFRQHPA